MSRKRKSGIVNVTMVITEEKILSNIDKVQKMINPNSKKQIVELEEDSDFKDLIESIKSYLIEYPNKKNFPLDIYKATYGLVEFATTQFEENTKKIEDLIKQREENIALSGKLKETIEKVDESEDDEGWNEDIKQLADKFSEDIIEALQVVGKSKTKKLQSYTDAMKLLHARVKNLESNLHIEIDIERLEDSSKALSYIGIEVADALKLIPTPEEQIEVIAEQNAKEEAQKIVNNIEEENELKDNVMAAITEDITEEDDIETLVEQSTNEIVEEQKEQYVENTTFEAKQSLWQRFKNSKFVRAATYVFRIKIRIELPSNALPEGRGENL